MKKVICLIFTTLLSTVILNAQHPWQKISFPTLKELEGNFKSPPAEYGMIHYIVHLNHEDQLPGLTKSSGDFFKNMRNVGIPGIDAIWAQIWIDQVADYPKLASSAAHLYGKPRAFTESFAAYTHKPSVEQAKWVLDYQLVRGINWVQIMFMSASANKQSTTTASAGPSRHFIFNEGKEKQSVQVTLTGKGTPVIWDAMTGEVSKIEKFVITDGKATLPIDFEPYETKFIVLSK